VSNFEEAREKLPFGIGGFDFTLVRTPDDAQSVIWTLPNRDRGMAARALFDVREKIGREAAFAGMMAGYEHDHREVITAFGSDPAASLARHHSQEG
jgi:hypothetical protein